MTRAAEYNERLECNTVLIQELLWTRLIPICDVTVSGANAKATAAYA